MKPMISVIISAYQTERLLPRCLDSLLKQTYKNFNVILVDNASHDSVPEICEEYAKKDPRIHVIHNTVNTGVGDGRNTGLDYLFENEPTEYLTFVDSDDWVHESFLEKLVDVAKKQDVDIVYCSHNQCKSENDTIDFTDNDFIPEKYTNTEDFWVDKIGCIAYCIGRLFRSELFHNIRFPHKKGLDDERTTYKAVLSAKSVAVIPAKLYNYFMNDCSYMHSQWSVEKKIDQLASIYEPFEYLYCHGYKKTFAKRIGYYFYYVCNTLLDYSDNPEFFDFIKTLKEEVINLSINYPDWLPYDNAKKRYILSTKYIIKRMYIYNKNEEKGIRSKLRAIKWLIKAKHNLYHKNKIFTRKAKAKYLHSIQVNNTI